MAGKFEATAPRIIVIDTSYILDFFGIPGSSSQSKKVDETAQREIEQRFENATRNGDRLFVPLPCIFEVGNHIAKAYRKDQYKLAQALLKEITTSVAGNLPWTITPTGDLKFLPELFEKFATEYAGKNIQIGEKRESIGLTDAFTIAEATRLKNHYPHRPVHIWTTDGLLKNYEPDEEENPYPPRTT